MGTICLYAWGRVGLGAGRGEGVAKGGRELGRGERLYGAKPLYILFGSHHYLSRPCHGLSSRDDEMDFMQSHFLKRYKWCALDICWSTFCH